MSVDFDFGGVTPSCTDTGFEAAVQALSVPFTFFIWARPTTINTGTGQCLMVKNRALAQGFVDTAHYTLEMVNNAGLVAREIGPLFTSGEATAGTMVADTWQTCAANFLSDSNRTAYYNGTPGTVNTDSVNTPDAGTITIGGRINAAGPTIFRPFLGCLAHAAIWNIALSDENHAELATGVLPPNIAAGSLVGNLILYTPMVDGSTVGDNTYGSFGDLTPYGSFATCGTSPPSPPSPGGVMASVRWI